MAQKDSPEPTEFEHSYLVVGSTGPRGWVLAIITLVVGLIILAVFYGLYTINRGASPTLSPDALALTQAAAAGTPLASESMPTPSALPAGITPTPSPIGTVIPTTEAPTYTVNQGDTLIAIASRLNVNVNELTALNQISGETIFPGQVLLVPPTVTPWPETGPFPHIVKQGETLLSIATLYSVTVQEIKTLNRLTSDTIFSGQRILIPAGGVRPPTPTSTPEPWQPAIITGDLEVIYSLATVKGHFTLHIPPDTRAAAASETAKVARLVETALDHSQKVLKWRLSGRFAVYVAGTLFDAPYTNRRSFSLPDEGRLFLLYDGSGTPAERLYFTTYALTSLLAAQKLGDAASPLLGEGLAVYAGGQALASETAQGRHYLSLTQFCAAYQQAGRLPRVSRSLTLEGHLGYLDQHFTAGCFVGYLIEEGGWEAFVQVYHSGDYRAAYGQQLRQLESAWITALRDAAEDLPFDETQDRPFDPDELVRIVTEVDEAYRRLWADFEGTPTQFAAYERLDRARLAILQRRLATAQEHLEALEELLE